MNPGQNDFKLVWFVFYFCLFKDFVFTPGTKENTNQNKFETILTWDSF